MIKFQNLEYVIIKVDNDRAIKYKDGRLEIYVVIAPNHTYGFGDKFKTIFKDLKYIVKVSPRYRVSES